MAQCQVMSPNNNYEQTLTIQIQPNVRNNRKST